jgi:uncharacterized peroxidase-related enzyme
MVRIKPVQLGTADAVTEELLNGVKKKMGMVPNLIAGMAHSVPVAKAYLGFSQTLAGDSLPARLREQIALVVGEANGCDYCVSAHTFLGKRAGLSQSETLAAREGEAIDPAESAALKFALRVVETRGKVSDEEIQTVREAGYDDRQIAEIVSHVSLNIFTNYFNNVAQTPIDFPVAPELASVS